MSCGRVLVIGAGLAGCEAAWQLARRGIRVRLVDMKPAERTPAHHLPTKAELVCSNSLRGASLSGAVGLLKEELRRLDSLLLRVADETAVPAGRALAVDRHLFSQRIEQLLTDCPLIEIETRHVETLPEEGPVIIATGPMTDGRLLEALAAHGATLNYHDAIAPLIAADSIDYDVVYRKDRWEEVTEESSYLNCPFDRAGYEAFVRALIEAEKTPLHDFETAPFFEGCLPVEEMAARGMETLAHGPLKPVGLVDPRTGKRAWAVAQLRREDAAGTSYNLVGFQTRLTRLAQLRVLRMIPGLEHAKIERYGQVHRNTFVDAPSVLDEHLRLKCSPHLRLAGQLTGVEGYVESIASGFLAAVYLAGEMAGVSVPLPPPQSALGGLARHTGRIGGPYQPSNVVWAMIDTPVRDKRKIGKNDFREVCAKNALDLISEWKETLPPTTAAPVNC